MRFTKGAFNPQVLRERAALTEQVKEVMELTGWKHIENNLGVLVEQAAADAAKAPTSDETPHQRYYRLGFAHGVRAAAGVAQRLVVVNELSENEKARLTLEVVK